MLRPRIALLNDGRDLSVLAKSTLVVSMLLWLPSGAAGYAGSKAKQSSPIQSAQQSAGNNQKQAEASELKPGQVIEREMAGGEADTYRIVLASGQYLKMVVEQKGIDVVVKLFGTDGQKMAEVDNDPAVGIESVAVVAEASGDYRLEVRSQNKNVALGRYEIKIEEWREATSIDRVYVRAQQAYEEAKQLRDQQTAESRQQAIKKFEEALSLWREAGNPKGETYTLNEIGIIYSRNGEQQKAMESYRQALQLSHSIRSLHLEAATLTNAGMSFWRRGQSDQALEYFNQALPLRRTVGDHQGEAITLNNMGLTYASLGQLQEALKFYIQALPLSRVVGDTRLEAIVLNNMGAIYKRVGEFQQALEYYYQVLPLKRAMGDRQSEANTLHNVGAIYMDLGEPRKALEYYQQALVVSRAVGDRLGETATLDNLGTVYRKLDEPQKELEYYAQALALARALGDRRQEAYILTHLGSAYQFASQPQKGLDYFNQALLIRREVGDQYGEIFSLSGLGSSYRALGQPQKALEYYQQALRLSQAIGDRGSEANRLSEMAQVERQLGHLNEARAQIEAALETIESNRAKVTSQELRTSYLASKQDRYLFYIDLLMQMHQDQPSAGHDAAALQASERARARSLLEILTEARAEIRQGVDTVLLERERLLQQQLSAKSEQLARLLSGKHTEEQETTARKEVEALLGGYQEVEAQIRAKSPRYAALTQPQPLSLIEIQQRVLDENTLLLEYSLGEERSYLWAVTPASIKTYELPARAEIEATARRVNELLVAKADGLYPQTLTTLSQMLLQPVAEELGRKRLLIVSQGVLQYVPFGALPDPSSHVPRTRSRAGVSKDRSEPLIVNHEIVSLPSASVLATLRREFGSRKSALRTVAVLADPVFDKHDQRVKSNAKSNEQNTAEKKAVNTSTISDLERSIEKLGVNSFDRLTLSRREAELITASAPKGRSLKALDFMASRATALSPDLEQYHIVHFATHSLINNQHPELSGIVLSLVDEHGNPQDGFLRLYEIYNLKLNADLVVLSACQTALGKDIKGEGLVGLTRGFMYAGAPRVVASLWKVSDNATAELMNRFYQKMLTEGLRPAAALRAAQVSMLKQKQWGAAYYWAGFVLQGEWK